jgi:hypothetical protein
VCVDQCICVCFHTPTTTRQRNLYSHGECVFCCEEEEEEHKCEGIHDLHYSIHEENVYGVMCVSGSVYSVCVFLCTACAFVLQNWWNVKSADICTFVHNVQCKTLRCLSTDKLACIFFLFFYE